MRAARVVRGRLSRRARRRARGRLVVATIGPAELAFARDERLVGLAAPRRGCRTRRAGAEPCEEDHGIERGPSTVRARGAAARLPPAVDGLTTGAPVRALAARALARLAPDDDGEWPVLAPLLGIEPPVRPSAPIPPSSGGEWAGACDGRGAGAQPVPLRRRARRARPGGAFEVDGLPAPFALRPARERERPFALIGGSWSPGGDPLLAALFEWAAARRRGRASCCSTRPERVRTWCADVVTRRVGCSRERPASRRRR